MDIEIEPPDVDPQVDNILHHSSWPIIFFSHRDGVTIEELAEAYRTTPRVIRVMLRRWQQKLVKMKLAPLSGRA